MNWLTDFVRPKIKALIQRNVVPDDLWTKCPKCDRMLFSKDLASYLYVCHHCQHHLRMTLSQRFESFFDDKDFFLVPLGKVVQDPIHFKDMKKYTDRLKEYRAKTSLQDSVGVATGKVNGYTVVVAAFDFNFMGGSMGIAAGEAIVRASEIAIENKMPLIIIPASGGARMQEGILSLMQMARTTIAVQNVKEAGIPYIVLLTDPTTGGVSASFAMLGDVIMSEPGALIGFTGRRVIEETIKQKLPDDFQTAEYLQEHGVVDMVVHRHKLKETLGRMFYCIHPTQKTAFIEK